MSNQKQQTPLAKSIQRKVKRLKKLESLLKVNNLFLDGEIHVLKSEIAEDKKHLAEERGNMISIHVKSTTDLLCEMHGCSESEISELDMKTIKQEAVEYFDTHYTQEIQES